MPNSEQHIIKNALSPNRLEALTDGVFAIVMTLLVLGLSVPMFKGSSMHQQFTQLLEMWPKFASYVATFLMLVYMWSMHHWQFSLAYVAKTQNRPRWVGFTIASSLAK